MNMSRFIMAVVAAYIVMAVVGFGSDMVLKQYYDSYMAIARPEAEMMAMMPLFLVAYLVQTVLFCYIYIRGRETGDLMEGIRFGILIGVFMGTTNVILYTGLPLSMETLVAGISAGIAVYICGGIAAALVYKPAASEQG
ncbi:hypothetical protein [Emcibacter sp.]|uniref:hypothetical protein n=1 Tax=Emcibacter sp. TaxID=1979954 RepID=UPI002AA694B6|nr:hypothetical protein [Emcibacter sp.]